MDKDEQVNTVGDGGNTEHISVEQCAIVTSIGAVAEGKMILGGWIVDEGKLIHAWTTTRDCANDPVEAVLCGIRKTICCAYNKGLRKIIIQVNNKASIDRLNAKTEFEQEAGLIAKDIYLLLAFGSKSTVSMEAVESANPNSKIMNVGLLLVATLVAAKLISALIMPRSKKRLPPTVRAWPVLGGLIRFMKGPVVMLREEYPKLGSVFTLKLLNKNITFLIGPEVSAHFFKAPESDLSQQEVYQFNVPTFGPGVVFDVDYTIRQEQFRFFTEALRVNKLKGYVDQMVMEAECYIPLPSNPAHRRRDQARKKLAEIFAKIIASRKQTGKTENDLLQCFIDSKYKDGRQTTESEVTGLLIAALFAGQHTSSITSTWTGAYLLCNPKYMSAVLGEQKNLVQKHGNEVNYDVLSEMEVLYRSIKEALRLHPPLIMLLRSSHSDFSVTTKEGIEYDIRRDILLPRHRLFANRLPHIYENPDVYDPDRFAPGRDEDKAAGAFSYISFGGGRHGCLGEPFAYLQIKAIWSHLLRNFEMELVSPFPEIDWNAMVVGVKGNVMVRYKRRALPLD
ncbi:hypothetical protein DH2020_006879 [Rehmannia glutinosa]|uniref:Uncharacterized protein n=1 Tax=Rehmannia glutinosa TaxID=99300 RepID=A0ABR0XK67_REHGL